MKFDSKFLTKKQLRKHICTFAKTFGVKKVIFNASAKRIYGSYNASAGILFLSLNQTKKEMLNALFHELSHHESVKKRKWIKYHFNLYKTINHEREFCIENKIDKMGKILWNRYVITSKWGNYKYFYPKKNKKAMTNFFETNQ